MKLHARHRKENQNQKREKTLYKYQVSISASQEAIPAASELPVRLRIYLATLQMGFASFACGVYPLLSNRRDYCILVGRKWHVENQRQLSIFGVQPWLGVTQMVEIPGA